jgi:hypothetical protein
MNISDEAMADFANSKETGGDSYHMCSQAYGDGIELGWQECRRRQEPLLELNRNLIISYDSGDMTAVEGFLNQIQEIVK